VVVVCGGGSCIICGREDTYILYIYICKRLDPPAHVVVSPTGADTKLMLGQLALCGGVLWVVVVDAYVYVVAVVVAMGCWCWENVLVLVKENVS